MIHKNKFLTCTRFNEGKITDLAGKGTWTSTNKFINNGPFGYKSIRVENGGYLHLTNLTELLETSDFTISLWTKIDSFYSFKPPTTWAQLIGNLYSNNMHSVYNGGNAISIWGNSSTSVSSAEAAEGLSAWKEDNALSFGYYDTLGHLWYGEKRVVDSIWHHIALVRKSSTLYFFIDGKLMKTGIIGNVSINTTCPWIMGKTNDKDSYTSYINADYDDICIIKNEALWVSDFNTPTTYLYEYLIDGTNGDLHIY